MGFQSINPFTGDTVKQVDYWPWDKTQKALDLATKVRPIWQKTSLTDRQKHLSQVANLLRERKDALALMMTQEMGKLIKESEAEVEKCAWVCDYYAENGAKFLADEVIESDAGKSYVTHQPLGTVLAVMPWNFPLWQVFRFAAPALVAGNTALLKHASNVPDAALAIERLFLDAGLPKGVFTTLMISSGDVAKVIENNCVNAITLTGSENAGRQVASTAGKNLKKTVLELGGSDAFIVLKDCDLQKAVEIGVMSRFLNAGQSCIAAKRFIVVDAIANRFVSAFKTAVESLVVGDPSSADTTLAPMVLTELRDEIHQQVQDSIAKGAVAVCGCEHSSEAHAGYMPSIIDHVQPGMRAYNEELFGPVAIIIRAKDEDDAVRIANDSSFGLGGSVWTQDLARGERIARQIESGASFVNGIVKSDPRLPFGGIKNSGYGRELSKIGMLEFVNTKTIWIASS